MEDNSNVDQYMDSLMDLYNPTGNQSDATHQFSTDEIYDAIKSLNPGVEISKNDIYNAMINRGFIFKPRLGAGLEFRWLLIQK